MARLLTSVKHNRAESAQGREARIAAYRTATARNAVSGVWFGVEGFWLPISNESMEPTGQSPLHVR